MVGTEPGGYFARNYFGSMTLTTAVLTHCSLMFCKRSATDRGLNLRFDPADSTNAEEMLAKSASARSLPPPIKRSDSLGLSLGTLFRRVQLFLFTSGDVVGYAYKIFHVCTVLWCSHAAASTSYRSQRFPR
jgi:hypothetical protein